MKALFTFLLLSLVSFNSYAINATHGMVLFGEEKLMAYHLPMFHNIHAKQVVLEYTLPEEVKNKLLSYQNDDFLTFVPAPFDLEKFLLQPFPLKGDVYKGHFEKDGELVMSDVTMENIEVLYKYGITKNSDAKDVYRLFGTTSDLYEVHILVDGIEKDHIAKAQIDTKNLEQVLLANRVLQYGYSVETYTGLLSDGSESVIGLPFEIPACNRRWCGSSYKHLKIKTEKTIFSDDVM